MQKLWYGIIALLVVCGLYYVSSEFLYRDPLALFTQSYMTTGGYNTSYIEPMNQCPIEDKICPDGSTVARSGPQCDFPACPPEKIFEQKNPTIDGSKPIPSGFKRYTNARFHYVVDYPANRVAKDTSFYRSGSELGATFSPSNITHSASNYPITVSEDGRGIGECTMPFKAYVKGVRQNIQNGIKLNSITLVNNKNGLEGYTITILMRPNTDNIYGYGSKEPNTVTLPTTYFEDKSPDCDNVHSLVTFTLNDKKYLKIYNQMIASFGYIQ